MSSNHTILNHSIAQSLLILLNGGRMSRNYLMGIGRAAEQLGLRVASVEVDELRTAFRVNPQIASQQLDSVLAEHNVGAVLGYVFNGCDLPGQSFHGIYRSFFELRGIPHLMYWTDHPQWAADRYGLRPETQAFFRSPNCHHFVKTGAHAYELSRMLGWPNCHAMPLAVCPQEVTPTQGVEPEFDVVAIYGGVQQPDPVFEPFLTQDDPDPRQIEKAMLRQVRVEIKDLLHTGVPENLRIEVQAFAMRLVDQRLAQPMTAAARHLPALSTEFPNAALFLTLHPTIYFKLTNICYRFRAWLRPFMPAYLARHFDLAVLGGDWRAVGCHKAESGPGSDDWVNLQDMSAALVRGKVVLNLTAGYDEEGITAKPFEIAAAGCCMVHNDSAGLADHFTPGKEIITFTRPGEAREAIAALLADPERRAAIATAARARVEREGNWADRLPRMLKLAGLDVARFRQTTGVTPSAIAA